MELRGGLRVEVDGLEAPIALCPPADPWDSTPCVASADLGLDHPTASLDDRGRLAFRDDLALDDVVLLGRGGALLTPRLVLGGVSISDLSFTLRFDPVPPIVLAGALTGGAGPDLRVDVYEIADDRLVFGVSVLGGESRKSVHDAVTKAYRSQCLPSGSTGAQCAQGPTGPMGSPGADGLAGSVQIETGR